MLNYSTYSFFMSKIAKIFDMTIFACFQQFRNSIFRDSLAEQMATVTGNISDRITLTKAIVVKI
jgi:hypothetical protein